MLNNLLDGAMWTLIVIAVIVGGFEISSPKNKLFEDFVVKRERAMEKAVQKAVLACEADGLAGFYQDEFDDVGSLFGPDSPGEVFEDILREKECLSSETRSQVAKIFSGLEGIDEVQRRNFKPQDFDRLEKVISRLEANA